MTNGIVALPGSLIIPAVRAAGGGGFPPPPIAAFLPWAWYDFADATTVTLDGSGNISFVKDKSGLGHHIGQSNSARRPAPSTLNARGAATFVSASQTDLTLADGAGAPAPDPLAQPQVIFVVWTQTVAPANPPGTYWPGPYELSGLDLFMVNNNSTLRAQQGFNKINANVGDPGVPAAPFTQRTMTVIANGTASPFDSAIRVEGNQYNGLLDGGTISSVALGGRPSGGVGFHMDGQIGEVLIYGGPLTSGQIVAVESYLQTKWNAP